MKTTVKRKEKDLSQRIISNDNWSPVKTDIPTVNAEEGGLKKKPWDYSCEAWIPVLDTPDTLEYVIDLLRLQQRPPFIVLVDTGSTKQNFEKIEEMFGNDDDVEIHRLRFRGVKHPSDYPAIAMDLALSACRTEHLFCTHADVFLKRNDFIKELLLLCDEMRPCVGYQMTPRDHKDWELMVSHTATMLHIPTMDRINAAWSLRRLCNKQGLELIKNHPKMGNNWPDTEILYNYLMWEHGYKGKFIGTEKNFERTNDMNIDHCRSLTAGRLYSPEHSARAQAWLDDAIIQAKIRISDWRKNK